MAFLSSALREAQGRVLDIGARYINGSVSEALPPLAVYIGLDIEPGVGVDVVADASQKLPLDELDVVTCSSVFEHTPKGPDICREAYKALKVGGLFVVTTVDERWPTHSAVDGGTLRPGEYYGAVSSQDLIKWLEAAGFVHIHGTVTHRGDLFFTARRML